MKAALIILACLILTLVCCAETANDTNSKRTVIPVRYKRYDIIESDMHYVMFSKHRGGVTIINVTKDSLETELIRKQLSTNY